MKHIAPKGAKNLMAILATNMLPLRGKEQVQIDGKKSLSSLCHISF